MKAKLAKAKVPLTCAVTGYADAALDAAHIYPDCWINDIDVALRLKAYFPVKTKAQRKTLIAILKATFNRIILDTRPQVLRRQGQERCQAGALGLRAGSESRRLHGCRQD